jgi:hypothetical protein
MDLSLLFLHRQGLAERYWSEDRPTRRSHGSSRRSGRFPALPYPPLEQIDCSRQYLNTHKPKEDRWLKAHPNVYLHFIPTHSSWLNQVECWFSILSWIRVVSRESPPSIGIFECGRFPEVVV